MSLYSASERELASMHAAFAARLESGTLRLVVSMEFSLAVAAKAHLAVIEGSSLGKIVLLS